jgi:flagellar assembly factor FliW
MEQSLEMQAVEVNFPAGLFGFEEQTTLVFEPVSDAGTVALMSAVGDEAPSWLVVDPWAIIPDYSPEIPDEQLATIGSPTPAELTLLVICRRGDEDQILLNLRAPVAVNTTTNVGCQLHLDGGLHTQAAVVPAAALQQLT